MSNPSGHDATALFLYPPQTAVNRPIPKKKLYEHGGANTRLQARFVQQVEQIIWAHKLAPDTLNLPGTADVPEIEVLRLHLRTAELDHEILRSIDRAMPRPILFELHRPDQIQVVATCKRPNQADPASLHWVSFPSYASSPWLAAQTTRHPLPLAREEPIRELLDALEGVKVPQLAALAAEVGEQVEAPQLPPDIYALAAVEPEPEPAAGEPVRKAIIAANLLGRSGIEVGWLLEHGTLLTNLDRYPPEQSSALRAIAAVLNIDGEDN